MGALTKTVKATTLAGILICCLTACGEIKLAPKYDKSIVFAAASSGTTVATYDKRENTYNKLIGSIDALAIQTE